MKSETMTAVGMPRRDFLRNSVMLTLPMMAGSALLGITGKAAAATQTVYVPPTRQRGTTVVNVHTFGAVGDGVHDDTSAIQAAINSLPSAGGTVVVPAGTYLVDAVRSIKLRSLMMLQMDPNAILTAKPNSSDSYNVLFVDVCHDVEIAGGQIRGERDNHLGTVGEGGHGIRVRGSQSVTIRDIRISNCWGDGVTVGPLPNYKKVFTYSRDVAIANIICTGNRRNGLSIGNVIGIKVFDSEFSYTNGTSPMCGIDVEPDKDVDGNGYNDQVWIENCRMNNNAHYGVNVWNRARNLTITKCTVEDNQTCGIVTTGLNGGNFTENTIRNNMSTGLFIKTGTQAVSISNNTSSNNYLKQGLTKRTPFSLVGVNSKVKKDIIVGAGTSGIQVGNNNYA